MTNYTGSCYIGVVGPENEIGECRDSIESILRRQGDTRPQPIRATKGYEAREMHFEKWLEQTDCPFMLLLDHDMIYPPDTLERLRSHKLPYVSGYYLRRRYAPIAPVWFEPFAGMWPLKPYTLDPERDKLHELGASGWGCILIHRDVVKAVREILHGEGLVLEDDMDIWPYDLPKIVESISQLSTLTTAQDLYDIEAMRACVKTLTEQVRVLRGSKDPIGSDIRFPYFARQVGFALMGDPDVRCKHMLNYPLSPDDYGGQDEETQARFAKEILTSFWPERRRMTEMLRIESGEAWRCQGCMAVNPVALTVCDLCGGAR